MAHQRISRRKGSAPARPGRFKLAIALLAGSVLAAGLVAWGAYESSGRTPGELLRYTEFRLYGHTKLEWLLLPALQTIRSRVERPVPPRPLPALGKGVQSAVPGTLSFDDKGRPRSDWTYGAADAAHADKIVVFDVATLQAAMRDARAGQTIEIGPGAYRVNRSLATRNPGTAGNPVRVRAAEPGTAKIEFESSEGFHVFKPYWVFENLSMRGICAADDNCEHAFHIVGDAQGIVIRNNLIQDFNAHIKVNGMGASFPDDGLIQHNTIVNTRTRMSDKPVTPIDIVAGSRWMVADNVIGDFVKRGRDGLSYGVFMKGAGESGRIERNLLICTPRDVSEPGARVGTGTRVGISMGGGGTGTAYCRDKACTAEHTGGVIANNVVAHCNDFGIDVNRSNRITIAHNTLINTAGIDVRRAPASAEVHANLLEGRVRARDEGWVEQGHNLIGSLEGVFNHADSLDLGWKRSLTPVPTAGGVTEDFCRRKRGPMSAPGAMAESAPCNPPAAPAVRG